MQALQAILQGYVQTLANRRPAVSPTGLVAIRPFA